MSHEPIEILYRTQIKRERPGPYGALMRRVAAHPVLSGALGGALAIAIALARGWRGAATMPEAAVVLCLLVLAVWMVLFWFMRRFFLQQTREVVEVVRRLRVSPEEGLSWQQGPELLCQIEDPIWRMTRSPGEGPASEDHPWKVWVLAFSHEDDALPPLERAPRFSLETRVMWREARRYPMEDQRSDELLPSHIASPLLELARGGKEVEKD